MTSLEQVAHRHDDSLKKTEANRVAPGSPILELKGLQKNYGYVQALKPATVTFLAGEIHAIVGENGAGKSTLIKLLWVNSNRVGASWKSHPTSASATSPSTSWKTWTAQRRRCNTWSGWHPR